MCRQGRDGVDEPVPDGFGGVVIWQVDEHHVARGAFDQGSDCGLVVGASNEVTLPMAGYCTVLDLGWTLGDHDHRIHEPGGALFPALVLFPAGPACAQGGLYFAFESASGLDVEGLINRLWTHTHLRLVGELFDQGVADLLRRPAYEQLGLHVVAQVRLASELGGFGSCPPGSGLPMRPVREIAQQGIGISAQLPADR